METPGCAQYPDEGSEVTGLGTASGADFPSIYQAEAGFVWNRLRRLGVPERDLEDKVQDVFIVAHRRLESYDRSRPIRAWLAGISVRVALDHRRLAHQRREVSADVSETPAEARSPESTAIEAEARRTVLDALDELPPEQRAVFVLKELEGFSMPEIAEIVDAPLNTLYSRLRLARERFAAAVQARRAAEAGAR
jgi:RNA polymerase sigma-70 factor (ECF subfamily)